MNPKVMGITVEVVWALIDTGQKKDTGTMSEELTGHQSAYYSTTALHPEDRDLCCGLSETKLSSSRNDR